MRKYKQAHQNPNRIRYGWRISQAGYHMVDSSARKTIMKILVMRRSGYSFEKIKNSLEEMQLASPRKSSWHCGTIKKIVSTNNSSLPQINL